MVFTVFSGGWLGLKLFSWMRKLKLEEAGAVDVTATWLSCSEGMKASCPAVCPSQPRQLQTLGLGSALLLILWIPLPIPPASMHLLTSALCWGAKGLRGSDLFGLWSNPYLLLGIAV